MTACALCDRPVAGAPLVDPDTGAGVHVACFAGRIPHDLAVAAVAALVLVLAPPIVLWAG
jgi:hypothetical protein